MLALSLAYINNETKFVDIGCGDGRVAIIASKYFKSKTICVEVREELCALAEANAIENGVKDLFEIRCTDAKEINYEEFDVVFMYMFPSFINKISSKLEQELKYGSRILTVDFPIEKWIPVTMRRTMDELDILRNIYLYVIGISNPKDWNIKKFSIFPKF